MAHYLNYPFVTPAQPVAHDVATLCKSVEGFVKAYKEEGMWGSVEIAGMIGWQLIRKEMPDLKTVVVRRPLQEVYGSIVGLGLQANLSNLAEFNAILDLISEQPNVYSINSRDLDAPVVGKWLFEYCLELEWDFDWWYQLNQMNIQIKIDEAMGIKDEAAERYNLYQKDVLDRMKEIGSCLN
jgi:hypothetical protein